MVEAVRILYEQSKHPEHLNSADDRPIDRYFLTVEQKEIIRRTGSAVLCTEREVSATI